MAISGARLFRPDLTRCGNEIYPGRLSPLRAAKPCRWMLKGRCRNGGDTHSALCLSSARIWSLGFRVYLQKTKKKDKFFTSNPAVLLQSFKLLRHTRIEKVLIHSLGANIIKDRPEFSLKDKDRSGIKVRSPLFLVRLNWN